MSTENDDVLKLPKGERYIRYCIAIQEHKKAGLPFDEHVNELLAGLFRVEPAKLASQAPTRTPSQPMYRDPTSGWGGPSGAHGA